MTEAEATDILLGPYRAPKTWDATVRPGSCGEAMLEKAYASQYMMHEELYNIATYGTEDAIQALSLVRGFAAQLYVTRHRLGFLDARLREEEHG